DRVAEGAEPRGEIRGGLRLLHRQLRRRVQLLVGGEERRHLRVDHLIERLLRGERGSDEEKRENESFHGAAKLSRLTTMRDRTHQRFPERASYRAVKGRSFMKNHAVVVLLYLSLLKI